MPGHHAPPGTPGCSASATAPGNHDGEGSSDSPAPTACTPRRTSPSASMRLISPYSAAVSAPPVRNQVAPGTSRSSTSSNSARTRSLATPRILSSYTRGRFVVTSLAFPCVALMLTIGGGVAPGHHPGVTRGRVKPAARARVGAASQVTGQGHRDQRQYVRPEPAGTAPGPSGAQGAERWPAPKARVRRRAAGAPGGSLRLRQDQPARGMGHDDRRAGCLAVLR
jgi:hypothetical protein